MRLRNLAGSLVLLAGLSSLNGCASIDFAANQNASSAVVRQLQKDFQLANFKKSEVVDGHYDFSSGGTPNASFIAEAAAGMTDVAACKSTDEYATSLSSGALNYYPEIFIADRRGLSFCLADMKNAYNNSFEWHGKLKSGEPFAVILSKAATYTLTVRTDFQTPASDPSLEDGSQIVGPDKTLTAYLDGLQQYRISHKVELFSPTILATAGLTAQSKTLAVTPVIDSDGFIRKLKVTYPNGGAPDCYSAMPWDDKAWGIADPGPSYPTYAVRKLKELNNFGSYVMNSDCKTVKSN